MKKSNIKDFLLYLVVGLGATVSEWIIFYFLLKIHFHYALATVLAYLLSTLVNWGMGRALVFRDSKIPFLRDIISIYTASIMGMLLNLLIMWLTVGCFEMDKMLAKITATAIVFIYNFLVRKVIIYRK